MSEHEHKESADEQVVRERRNTDAEASDRDNVSCVVLNQAPHHTNFDLALRNLHSD